MIIRDNALISEMYSFVQIAGKTGSTVRSEATSSANDDLVMAASLCDEMDSTRKVDVNDPILHSDNNVQELVIDPDTGFAIGGNY